MRLGMILLSVTWVYRPSCGKTLQLRNVSFRYRALLENRYARTQTDRQTDRDRKRESCSTRTPKIRLQHWTAVIWLGSLTRWGRLQHEDRDRRQTNLRATSFVEHRGLNELNRRPRGVHVRTIQRVCRTYRWLCDVPGISTSTSLSLTQTMSWSSSSSTVVGFNFSLDTF